MRNRTAFFALSLFISSSGYLAALPAIAADADPGHHENQAVLACTGAGSGFFLIPGTDTCLRIGGQITAWHEVNHARKDLYAETSYLVDAPMVVYDTVEPRPRPAKQTTESVLTFTTASMTDLGPLLTFASLKGAHSSDTSILHLDQAFIAAGGFTVGRRKSFFDYSTGYNFTEGYASDRTTNLAAYTHSLSEKASVTVSLEDNNERRVDDGVWALRGTQNLPDLVVAARLDDNRWGNAQVSVAVQQLSDDRVTECCGPLRSTIAWAASAGVEFNPVILRHEGRLLLAAAYADGAMSYLGDSPFVTDYMVDGDGKIVRTSGFSLLASYEYHWSPKLKSMLTLSGLFARTKGRDLEWKPSGMLASLGLEYQPVPNLRLGLEGNYYRDLGRARYYGIAGERSSASLAKLKTYVARNF